MNERTWKVSYAHLADMLAGYPFWKRTARVRAVSRKEAIAKVARNFPPPTYGRFKASPCEGEADSMFK